MTDIALFAFGCFISIICVAAIGLFVYGAYEDGLVDQPKNPAVPVKSAAHQESDAQAARH